MILSALWTELVVQRGNPPDAEYAFKHALVPLTATWGLGTPTLQTGGQGYASGVAAMCAAFEKDLDRAKAEIDVALFRPARRTDRANAIGDGPRRKPRDPPSTNWSLASSRAAKASKAPVQRHAAPRATGTDADTIQIFGGRTLGRMEWIAAVPATRSRADNGCGARR
jgi:hypothetical protein